MKYYLLIFIFCLQSQATVTSWTSTLPANSKFHISSEMQSRVNFWIKIYSYYNTKQGVFHIVDEPNLILGEIDLTSIYNSLTLADSRKKNLIENEIKNKKIFLAKKFKIDPAKIRLQMGLKDRMKNALFLSGKYIKQMEFIFQQEKLPTELTRLVFVESSFNVFAQSKVGASGLWQIMPSVARAEGYITKNYDKRNHPVYATKLAANILKQNYSALKSWPLAITAYNHGLTGVKRMMKKSQSVEIEDLIDSKENTRSWGFASKNFYACFLAVLEVERNASRLFGDELIKAESLALKEYSLPNHTKKTEVLKWYNGSITRFKNMNPHLNWSALKNKTSVPAGVPLMIPVQNFFLVKN